MEDARLLPLFGVVVLGLYYYIEIPVGYRRWGFLALLLVFPMLTDTPLRHLRIAVSGVTVQGSVTALHCTGGKYREIRLRYRFDAGGLQMDGHGYPGQGNGGCELRVGDPVWVSYLPAEPMVDQAVRRPMLALLQKLLGWIALCLFMTWLKTAQAERLREHFRAFSFTRP